MAAPRDAAHRTDAGPAVPGSAKALDSAGVGEADGHGAAAAVADVARPHEDASLAVALVARRTLAAPQRSLRGEGVEYDGQRDL